MRVFLYERDGNIRLFYGCKSRIIFSVKVSMRNETPVSFSVAREEIEKRCVFLKSMSLLPVCER